ncbi:TRAP transporter substrate-binding protein [Defluviitalea phaphyphila]|uniref:TRAP transporter substrate-binding protein n=1 Tax=Defluviitalea phaphyphila TaxID=1473580 RepID=UPI000730229E|nr:TRAP transporter substrate-binding protein [Defluviitalea phaphyphila]
MKKTIFTLFLISALILMLFTGCNNKEETTANSTESNIETQSQEQSQDQSLQQETIVLKLADNQPLESPLAQAGQKLSELVEEKTNGAVRIEVYPNAQLGEEAETTEQVKAGVLDLARVNVIQLTQYLKEYEVFTLPYMFSSDEHRWSVTDGEIGQSINKKLAEETGINVLAFLDSGWRCFYTKEKATSLADLKGMKIRVMDSAANVNMIKYLGATPTPMPYSDVFTALQTGVIDGAENDYVSYKTSGHFEVAKYYMVDRHTAGFGVFITSDAIKEKLTEEQYEILQECAKEAAEWQREAMVKEQEECKADVIEAGSTITEVDMTEFQEAVAPMYDEYEDLKPIIEEIKAMQ